MRLGRYRLNPETGDLLSGDGSAVPLKRQARTLLLTLAAAEGRIVRKDTLMDAIWPDVTVSEDSLYQAVAEARRALGKDGEKIVRTVPREGYRLVARTDRSTPAHWWRLARAFALLGGLIGGAFWTTWPTQPRLGAAPPVIAILPFDAPADDEVWSRLGRGLSGEIAAELARNSWLDVIAPEASATLAGSDPVPAAEALGAHFLLDGSLAADKSSVRVSARLTDTVSHKVMWAERWSRAPQQFLDLEQDILDRIGGSLGGALTGAIARAELEKARATPTDSLDAYDHFLLGLEAKHQWNAEGFALAAKHFRKAIELDPGYAKAWSFLSLDLTFLAEEAATQAERLRLWNEANAAAERAYALDPDDPEVLWRIARERAARGDFESAEVMLQRSVALAPGNADVLMVAAWTSHYAGVRGPEPLAWARRAHELTPVRPAKYTISLGLAAFSAREYALCAETLRNAPPTVEVLVHRAAAEALLGNISASRELAQRVRVTRPGFVMDDLFGPVGLEGHGSLDDLRRAVDISGLPKMRTAVLLQQ